MTPKGKPPPAYRPMLVVKNGMEFSCKEVYLGWKCGACNRRRLSPGDERCACGAVVKIADPPPACS